MRHEPWLHFWRSTNGNAERQIKESLKRGGISFIPLPSHAPAGDGILFFSDIEDELCSFVREISNSGIDRVLTICTSNAVLSAASGWRVLQAGAADLLEWTRDYSTQAERVKARLERWHAIDDLLISARETIVGVSPIWRSLMRRIIEVARFTTASVLLMGESGTGKEMLAQLIKELDFTARPDNLTVVDCTTIVPELSGSEFFGHERGAFTGAIAARDGAFALADGGILFLDEIGELPLNLQAQLLRVIQEGAYKRVGGNQWYNTKFRLVAATNKDLLAATQDGAFRTDLYYRIAGWVFNVPPLRARREDILPLARHFLQMLNPDRPIADFATAVEEYLLNRPYPGNIRDLRLLIARITHRHVGSGPITLGDIPEDERPTLETANDTWRDTVFETAVRHALVGGARLKEIGDAATSTAVRIAVHEANGKLQVAANRLGVSDRALQLRRANGQIRDGDGAG